MHRLRFIFCHKRRTDSKSSCRDRGAAHAKTKPVLKRCSALKNIDFEQTQEFYASVEWNDKKSFRIEGDDDKIESIFRELGLSGSDDFEIPVAAWVAMKVSSSWYDLPGLCNSPDSVRVTDRRFPVNDEPDSCKVTRFPASGVIDLKIEANDSEISEVCGENHRHVDCVCSGSGAVLKGEMCEIANRVSDSVSLNINDVTFNKAGVVEALRV